MLALNCGSSSLKFGLFQAGAAGPELVLDGEVEAIGTSEARLSARPRGGARSSQSGAIASHALAAREIFALLAEHDAAAPSGVGHRIVHGGPSVRNHCLIKPQIMRALEAAGAFAPLHAPPALEVVRIAQAQFNACPHFACLDTAFHHGLPDVAKRLPIAAALQVDGVERYGFHGLSCESILRQLGEAARKRLVIAHLGSGSSITAVKAGRSIDTSMGLTPSGGVMMATRAGDLDPGLLVYLIRKHGLNAAQLELAIDREAGMEGVSRLSGDLRRLREASQNPDARLAVQMFVYSVHKQIAAMAAALEGLELLVFTGGIGEHDAQTRAEICAGLSWLGFDPGAAQEWRGAQPRDDRPQIRVLPANEEEQIARHVLTLIAGVDPSAM
ncbi:MAG TPA: acetate/propionate family kinase [Caulobacteraceae bacterium]|nr:acetate/propionate family kinase [Caulobacteraceae bacterium]